MARATGLEPAASGVTGRRSNQLSYARSLNAQVQRAVTVVVYVSGTHPSSLGRGHAPLGKPSVGGRCLHALVGGEGIEPPTSSV